VSTALRAARVTEGAFTLRAGVYVSSASSVLSGFDLPGLSQRFPQRFSVSAVKDTAPRSGYPE